MDDVRARVLADGQVPQVVVEYIGPNAASATWRGIRSGTEYRFSSHPDDRFHWVHAADEERFRLLNSDFLVHDDLRIDPERDSRRAQEAEFARLEQLVAQLRTDLAARPVTIRTSGRPTGRPRIPDEHLIEDLHLKDHCGWTYQEVADRRGLHGEAPAAAMETRLRRARPKLRSTSECCPLCAADYCLPRPEEPTKVRL